MIAGFDFGDFREAFGDPQAHDVGKRVFRHSAGHLCMENDEQRDARLASDPVHVFNRDYGQ